MLKRVVFLALSLWALVDGFLTARDMPTPALRVIGFFGSFLLSALFLAIVVLTWNWITSWLRHHLAIMRLGQWLRRRTGTPALFAQAYASGFVEIVESLSASIVLFGGRRATGGAPETVRPTFETHFEMEQSGFEPIQKDIGILVVPGIEDARRADSELLRSAFRAAGGFLYVYSQSCARRYMKAGNAREFISLTVSICHRLAGRFGFSDDPQQVAEQIDHMLPRLSCERLLDMEGYGRNDALGRLLNCLSLSTSRDVQYGFVVGSMGQPCGCAWTVVRAAEAIDDSIKRCAEDMRW